MSHDDDENEVYRVAFSFLLAWAIALLILLWMSES